MTHWTDFLDPDGPDGAYLPWKKVEPRVGISRTTAWRLQKEGDFPTPYVVSRGRVAYRESEVEAWKASRGQRVAAALSLRAGPKTVKTPPAPAPAEPEPSSRTMPSAQPSIAVQAQAPLPTSRPSRPPLRSRPRRRADSDQMTFEF